MRRVAMLLLLNPSRVSVVTYEVAHQSAKAMAAQRPLPENAEKSCSRKYLENAEVLRDVVDLGRIFRAFLGGR
jgi:hypothetical protein